MKMAPTWLQLLKPEFEKKYMSNLEKFLQEEYADTTVFPKRQHIFRALELVDYDDVRVVILGQDPYHGPGQANGLAFAVNDGLKIPPSLRNIFKEVDKEFGYFPKNTSLLGWAEQGVLLLNTVLTVESGQANSHRLMGWEKFTDRIISLLNEREKPICFILWGSPARSKKRLISNKHHLILESPHPSPLSAHRGFFGCGHFLETNNWLLKEGRDPIDWKRSGGKND
jgi:uracil-DNA glycosylase